MDRKISIVPDNQVVGEFYDALAPDYDLMTGFEKRFIQERPFFHMLVDKFRIQSVLDAGSGTGFHSLLLAQLGVDVTAIDISPKMITFVRKHAKRLGLDVKALVSSFENIPNVVGESFDAVLSLGNSLAHAASREDLLHSLRAFGAVLRPAGILFIQNLNYDRILAQREKVQSVKEVGNKTFVRFYDYDEKSVTFNILTIERTEEGIDQRHRTIKLLPLVKSDIIGALESAGFMDIQVFGGISMEDFVPKTSKDLVILARLGKQGSAISGTSGN
jgi:SAM-dependent methyltransferase